MRETQVLMDLTRGVALASIPLAAAFDVLTLAQLVAVSFVVGLCTVVFDVANSTFIVSIVSKDELVSRNSLVTASSSVTQLAGPSLGGVLVQLFGAATCILADVVSYAASAVLLRSLPPAPRAAERPAGGTTVRRQIADGLGFVLRHRVMRPATVNVTIINFACGAFLALTPLFLVRTLSAGPALVGVLFASEGIGSLIGAAVAPRLSRRLGSAGALRAATVAAAALCLAMPAAMNGPVGYLVFALGNGGFAGAVVVVSVMTRTHRQTVTPRELLPRVMATVRFISWGVAPFGAAAAGVLASAAGIRTAFWVACCVVALAPLSLLASSVRTLRELDERELDEREPAVA